MIDGNAVRAARKAAHLSQVDLAKAVGMAQQTIAAIEQGRTKWTKFLPQIARALNKRLSELDPDWGAFDEQCSTVLPASRDEATSRARLDADYAFFAAEILRIRTKSGAIAPSCSTGRNSISMPRSRPSAPISAASAR